MFLDPLGSLQQKWIMSIILYVDICMTKGLLDCNKLSIVKLILIQSIYLGKIVFPWNIKENKFRSV